MLCNFSKRECALFLQELVYCNKERFVAMDELVPLTRAMTTPNAAFFCYDTSYAGNVSEVEVFYAQTMVYVDKI